MSQSKRLPEPNYCKTLNVIKTKLSIKMRFLDRLDVFAADELQTLIDVGQIRYQIFNNHIQFCSLLSVACPWLSSKGAMSSAHCRIWVLIEYKASWSTGSLERTRLKSAQSPEQSAGHVTCLCSCPFLRVRQLHPRGTSATPLSKTLARHSESSTFILGRHAAVTDNTTHSILKAYPQILAYLAKSRQLQCHVHD